MGFFGLLSPRRYYSPWHPKSGKKNSRLACRGQKSVVWMRDLVNKFSERAKMVPDIFSGIRTTAKACVELPRRYRFVATRCCLMLRCEFGGAAWDLCETYLEWEVDHFVYEWSVWCVQCNGSTASLIASKEADEIVKSSRWASPCAEVSIANHALHYKYICGSVFVRKGQSAYSEPTAVCVSAIIHELMVETLLVVK